MLIVWSEYLRIDWYINIYIYVFTCVVNVWVVEMREVVICVVWGLVGERGWLLAEEGEGWDRFTEGRWCGESTKSGS